MDTASQGFRIQYLPLCIAVVLLFPILANLFLTDLSLITPIFLPSQCKIVSSSLDIRLYKVCAFYSSDSRTSDFGCCYDYYWASVFEVEYKEHALGKTLFATAEAPNEALTLDCRPSFGDAWLAKDKFKVNKTYECWYTTGIPRLSLYRDGFFNCRKEEVSSMELIRRNAKIKRSWFTTKRSLFTKKKGIAAYWKLEIVGAVLAGFATSFIFIIFVKVLHPAKSWLARDLNRIGGLVFVKRACFLVAYFSFMGVLAIQFGKKLGFPEIYKTYLY